MSAVRADSALGFIVTPVQHPSKFAPREVRFKLPMCKREPAVIPRALAQSGSNSHEHTVGFALIE